MTETAVILVHSNNPETVTGNSALYRHVQHYRELTVILNVSAASGTTPTLDVVIEGLDPISGNTYPVLTFTQKTGVVIDTKYQDGGLGRMLRAKWTIGGTTPSFTFSILFI